MVSNASDDLPEPESPVMTVSRFRGIATEMFLRLCSRAPRTRRNSSDISPGTYRSARRHSSRRAPVLGIGRRSGGRLRPRPATFLSLQASYRSNLEERRMPLLKGTLDVLVLKALSFGPRHGFEITRWIEDGSHGEVPIESPVLLHALHRPQAGGAPPGAAPARGAPAGHRRLGCHREQPPGAVLQPDPFRPGAPPRQGRIAPELGGVPLGPAGRAHRRGRGRLMIPDEIRAGVRRLVQLAV